MQVIRYDLIGSGMAGVETHPQKEVERLGMKVYVFEGVPIADCVFMEVENIPETLPNYIQLSEYKLTILK